MVSIGRGEGMTTSAAISHAQRSLEIIRRMATVGVGPDTPPDVALQTIAAFAQQRLEALEELVRRG
jgi:hypothetical protein